MLTHLRPTYAFLLPRVLLLLSAVLWALVICVSGFSEEDWVKVAPPDTGFSVLMPTTPEPETHSVDVESGKVVSKMWRSKTAYGIYVASVTDYPEDIDSQEELKMDRDNLLSSVKAKLLSEKGITLKAYPGKEFVGASDTRTYKCRIYVVGTRRVYGVVAGEPTESFSATRADKLLQSFDLVEK